jgi:hypothetical protein
MVGGKLHNEVLNAWISHFSGLATPNMDMYCDEAYKNRISEDLLARRMIVVNNDELSGPIKPYEVSRAIKVQKQGR